MKNASIAAGIIAGLLVFLPVGAGVPFFSDHKQIHLSCVSQTKIPGKDAIWLEYPKEPAFFSVQHSFLVDGVKASAYMSVAITGLKNEEGEKPKRMPVANVVWNPGELIITVELEAPMSRNDLPPGSYSLMSYIIDRRTLEWTMEGMIVDKAGKRIEKGVETLQDRGAVYNPCELLPVSESKI